MSTSELDLRFGPGASAGFTPAGIAAFKDLRPAAVVRELLQNSLDARSPDQPTVRVWFSVKRQKLKKIPGLKSYWEALEAAVKTQKEMGDGQLSGQAELVVRAMTRVFGSDHDVLTVIDNGIGLNEKRMNALLSDGVSAKESAASTGTYGNGHCVAIPASDLRYVLYAGLTQDGARIASGHAVIASHAVPGELFRGGDGFLVRGFLDGVNGRIYDYGAEQDIPKLLLAALDDVENRFGHGTAVVIPAFNNFKEGSTSLWTMVSRAAACNFFGAIDEGKLIVEVQDSDGTRTLERRNLKTTLALFRDEKRSRAFLSGSKAWDALEALRTGLPHVIETDIGKVHVRLLHRQSGSPRIDLCRNGMWITNDNRLPGFYYKFGDREPFQAVLQLHPDEGGELYELIKQSEGPLHNRVNFKYLPRKDKHKVKSALIQIREWLRDHVPTVSKEEFSPDDFLVLEGEDGAEGSAGWTQQSLWGTPTAVERRLPARVPRIAPRPPVNPSDEPSPPRPNPPPRKSRRRSLPAFFQAVSVPTGAHRNRIEVYCAREYQNAELRLCLDENIDATCDRVPYNEMLFAVLSNTMLNGRPVSAAAQVRNTDGDMVGLRLGDLAPEDRICVETDWSFPPRTGGLDGEVSLQIQISKADPVEQGKTVG